MNLYSIASGAFTECTSLKSVHIKKSNLEYGTYIMDRAFESCPSLDYLTIESARFWGETCFKSTHIKTVVFPRTECRYFDFDVNEAEVDQILVNPYVKRLYLFAEWSGSIGKIVVNGKNTKIDEFCQGVKFGALYTVPKAKSINWAKKYKYTYKVKSCGKMGKVTHKK